MTLAGFVDRLVDDHTLLLRDRYGKTLVAVDGAALPYVPERFAKASLEDVIQVRGGVVAREKIDQDPKLPTGEIFLRTKKIEVLSPAAPLPPGVLGGDGEVPLEDRLTFRQLYLRRPDVQKRLELRSRVAFQIRELLVGKGFLEIETPQLFWYDRVAIGGEIVPAGGGKAFALSSGPVVLNQYLKPAGFDRTFQFTRITRRESAPSPLHAQEHTGLDINMSYVDWPDMAALVEEMLAHVWKSVLGQELKTPFARFSYEEAMAKFKTDKPDTRGAIELVSLPDAAPGSEVRALRLKGAVRQLAKKDLDGLAAALSSSGATLTWLRVITARVMEGSAAPLFKEKPALLQTMKGASGDVILLATAPAAEAAETLARKAAADVSRQAGLESGHALLWVHSYPFLENDEGNWVPRVVVFSRAVDEDKEKVLDREKRNEVRARAFDLVLDGVEIASGYIGNHNLGAQRLIWENIFHMSNPDLVRLRAPIEAHRFGVPPHGGLNLGFDRLIARLLDLGAIDEVMAFPKTSRCRDLLLDAPGPVSRETIGDLVAETPAPTFTDRDLAEEVIKS